MSKHHPTRDELGPPGLLRGVRRRRLRDQQRHRRWTQLTVDELEPRFAPAVANDLVETFLASMNASSSSAGVEVRNRYLFYNDSAFDGGPEADAFDDFAIALDKQALTPGQTAAFANYSSYSKGINGVIIDVWSLADPSALSAADFEFRTGNSNDPSSWQKAPDPTIVSVRAGEGVDDSDRITLVWPNDQIKNQWLQITVKAGPNTGLAKDDVFYFGNAVGETGDNPNNAIVNATDEIGARNNPRTFLNPAAIDDLYDFNRDGQVNATDQILARNHQTFFLTALQLITAPEEPAAPEVVVVASNLLTLTAREVEFLSSATSTGDPPSAILRDVLLTFTHLPSDFGDVSIALDEIYGYDDDNDGIVDGFALSTMIDLFDVDFSAGDRALLAMSRLTLGILDLEIRPLKDGGFRAGELVLDAYGLQLLPGAGGPSTPDELDAPGFGAIDLETGAVSLALDVPEAFSRSLTASGWIPFRITRLEASYDPAGADPDVAFSLAGFLDADKIVDELADLIGSPNLSAAIQVYDEQTQDLAPTSAAQPLVFGVAFVAGELRLTNTPSIKVLVENIDVPLGESLGVLTLDGFIAAGGFDGLGLPQPMPAELGEPFAGQQVVGSLSVASASEIGQIAGTVTLAGAIQSPTASHSWTSPDRPSSKETSPSSDSPAAARSPASSHGRSSSTTPPAPPPSRERPH